MLSKVAERVYWIGRYLERVENTARLLEVYDNLLFDLPHSVNLGWYNLIVINSAQSDFAERYKVQDERNVVKFLLGDEKNYCSMVHSLRMFRENVRTTRDVVPEETWELANELSLYVQDNLQKGINRTKRHEFLDMVIKGCQQIQGLLYGTMSHDASWHFLRLGRNIERADMTTRLLDAGSSAILQMDSDDSFVNGRQIIWGNVLRSAGADNPYRRTTRSSVNGSAVVHYMLEDPCFPRSIFHCLSAIEDSSSKLPRSEPVTAVINDVRTNAFKKIDYHDLGDPLRDHLNNLQIDLAKINSEIANTWFNQESVQTDLS